MLFSEYLSRMLFFFLHTVMVNKGHFRRFRGCDHPKHPPDPPLITPSQARHQDLAARGGQKPEGGVKKQKGGPHFQNTVLDVCSNRWAKREMGGHRFQMRGAPLALPLKTAATSAYAIS